MKRTQNGITLVALVITIIILLILAGISISALSGSGLFTKAQQAQNATENAQAEENEILENYLAKMEEVTGGSSSGGTTYTAYAVGDEVTVGSESFYVIKASDENTEIVTLLAKYNLNIAGTAQENVTYSSTSCGFIYSTNYWSSDFTSSPFELNNLGKESTGDAIAKAKAYGAAKGGTGRIMTYEEANTLKDSHSSMIYGTYSTDKFLYYWLGSAYDRSLVWVVDGKRGGLYTYLSSKGDFYGVRPVIEISKSLIQK